MYLREEDIINSEFAMNLAKKFAALSGRLIVIDKAKESIIDTHIFGQILALEAVWKKLGLDEMFEKVQSRYEVKYSLSKAVKLMVLSRLIQPQSKLSVSKWKGMIYSEEFGEIQLQHLYKSLDILAENREMLEEKLYERTLSLFQPVINVVFYDLTTVYFESQRQDGFRCYTKED
ncbi:MAG: hypothetical protein N2511_02360 [Thermodesulfovibrionales bacterium]|nr:hypothetical protein [Thermodesulfovibrionales bacterium]